MHETRCSGLVHWDDPEGWDEEGGATAKGVGVSLSGGPGSQHFTG